MDTAIHSEELPAEPLKVEFEFEARATEEGAIDETSAQTNLSSKKAKRRKKEKETEQRMPAQPPKRTAIALPALQNAFEEKRAIRLSIKDGKLKKIGKVRDRLYKYAVDAPQAAHTEIFETFNESSLQPFSVIVVYLDQEDAQRALAWFHGTKATLKPNLKPPDIEIKTKPGMPCHDLVKKLRQLSSPVDGSSQIAPPADSKDSVTRGNRSRKNTLSESGTAISTTHKQDLNSSQPHLPPLETTHTMADPKDLEGMDSPAEGKRLYIGNLAYATTEGELKDFFKEYLVESVSIPVNPRTERPVGYAFVNLSTSSEAEHAISELSGKSLLNRKVTVQLSQTNQPKLDIAETGQSVSSVPISTQDNSLSDLMAIDTVPQPVQPMQPAQSTHSTGATDEELQWRYFGQFEKQDGPRCINCAGRGHIAVDCPERTCKYCGQADAHVSRACPTATKCSKCGEKGHNEEKCTSKLRQTEADVVCEHCHDEGHSEENCPSFWRRIPPAFEVKRVEKLNIFCYNCAASDHWGGDCPLITNEARNVPYNSWSAKEAKKYLLDPSTHPPVPPAASAQEIREFNRTSALPSFLTVASAPKGLSFRGRAHGHRQAAIDLTQDEDRAPDNFLSGRVPRSVSGHMSVNLPAHPPQSRAAPVIGPRGSHNQSPQRGSRSQPYSHTNLPPRPKSPDDQFVRGKDGFMPYRPDYSAHPPPPSYVPSRRSRSPPEARRNDYRDRYDPRDRFESRPRNDPRIADERNRYDAREGNGLAREQQNGYNRGGGQAPRPPQWSDYEPYR